MIRVYGLGNRNATAAVAGRYEGTSSLEFSLSHATFFRAVLGAVADGGAGPTYTHTYSEANTLPSFAVDYGIELGANDSVVELKGCKVSSCVLTAAINEVCRVRLDCPYMSETHATSGIGSQVAASEDVFTFVQGTVDFPSGTTIANVQSFELTINNSPELVWGLGSRMASAFVEKQREYNFRCTACFLQLTDFLQDFYGQATGPLTTTTPAAVATLVLTFTNGGAAGALRSIVVTLANCYLDGESLPLDVNEVVKEDVTGWALSGTSVVWTNATVADNAVP